MTDRRHIPGPTTVGRKDLSDLIIDIERYVSDSTVKSDMHRVNGDLCRYLSRQRLTNKADTVLVFRRDLQRLRSTWTDAEDDIVEDYFSRIEEMLYAQMGLSSGCDGGTSSEAAEDMVHRHSHECGDRTASGRDHDSAFGLDMSDDDYHHECSSPSSYSAYHGGSGACGGGWRTLQKILTDDVYRCNRRSSVALVIATMALVVAAWTLCDILSVQRQERGSDRPLVDEL